MLLPRKTWNCSLNRIGTEHARTKEMLFELEMTNSIQCDGGNPAKNVKRIVQECSLRKFHGTRDDVITASLEAITRIKPLDLELQILNLNNDDCCNTIDLLYFIILYYRILYLIQLLFYTYTILYYVLNVNNVCFITVIYSY